MCIRTVSRKKFSWILRPISSKFTSALHPSKQTVVLHCRTRMSTCMHVHACHISDHMCWTGFSYLICLWCYESIPYACVVYKTVASSDGNFQIKPGALTKVSSQFVPQVLKSSIHNTQTYEIRPYRHQM